MNKDFCCVVLFRIFFLPLLLSLQFPFIWLYFLFDNLSNVLRYKCISLCPTLLPVQIQTIFNVLYIILPPDDSGYILLWLLSFYLQRKSDENKNVCSRLGSNIISENNLKYNKMDEK